MQRSLALCITLHYIECVNTTQSGTVDRAQLHPCETCGRPLAAAGDDLCHHCATFGEGPFEGEAAREALATCPGGACNCGQAAAILNMDKIVEYVRGAGFAAYVEQTGGGCATIYASRTADERGLPARPDGDHCEVVAGPGWFAGPNWTKPQAAVLDLWVGLDDDGQTQGETTTSVDDEASVAQRMIERLRGLA